MSAPALRVAGLGKRYRLGLTHAGSLSEAANRWTRRLRGLPPVEAPVGAAPKASPAEKKGDFWALRDVSLDVQPGEVVGVIGRNGAGKSTLLKILSRVTGPTVGEVRVRGRVGSLLEVGTGFHPELTGRENVYMNATLLGMSSREVRAKLEEIVDFAGVEKFLDTPVKRYSSGMKVRLGFAVAAHLEPEVLIVDEVLSVGDTEFQKKCLGKMQDVAGHGRTVLFVSHNMAAVEALCDRAVMLANGMLDYQGATADVVTRYVNQAASGGVMDKAERIARCRAASALAWIEDVAILSANGVKTSETRSGDPLIIEIACRANELMRTPDLGVGVNSSDSSRVTTLHTGFVTNFDYRKVEGEFRLRCVASELALAPGSYTLKVSLEPARGPRHMVEEALRFTVVGGGALCPAGKAGRGVVLCSAAWTVVPASSTTHSHLTAVEALG